MLSIGILGAQANNIAQNITNPPAYATLALDYKSTSISLSNGDLTATHAGPDNSWHHVATMAAKSSGKWYCEVTCNFVSGSDFGVAVGNYKNRLNGTYLASNTNAIMHVPDGRVIYNNGNQIGGPGAYTTGTVIGVALDADAGTVRFNHNGGAWSSAYTVAGGKALMLMIQMWKTGDEATVNFGETPFAYTPYSGHEGWLANEPASGRYWRYHVVVADASNTSLAEIELRQTPGGVDETGSGTPSQLSTFSSPTYTADKAVDDNTSTIAHCANNQATGWWWQYDFGETKEIVEAAITMRDDILQYPVDWRLVFSDDATNWFPAIARNAESFTIGETKTFTFG